MRIACHINYLNYGWYKLMNLLTLMGEKYTLPNRYDGISCLSIVLASLKYTEIIL